ncbi:hypothetical protein BDP27DRAFT_1314232 [Rhodocollybia butyracea]|uniref:Uncharacterized protein n=1 Tax=Rhodocollybia butyracea TaxID=206335 RepID=A0A9P5Q7W9_9AGAR|nr:hypothetical protein BDP27DRAFT_1314232 [Rhodocollybia butyracea]
MMLNQPWFILCTVFFGVIHEILAAPLSSEFTYIAFGTRTSNLPLATNQKLGTATGANPVTTYLYNEAMEDSDSGSFSGFGTIVASASGFAYTIVQWSVPTGTSSTLSPTAIATLAEQCFYTNSFSGACVDPIHSSTLATGHAITGTLSESQAAFASTNTNTPTPTSSGKKSDAGAIAGGIFGGVLGITLIIVVIVYLLRRRRNEQENPPSPGPDIMSERNPLINLGRTDIQAIAREVAAVITRSNHAAEAPEAEEIRDGGQVVDVTAEGKVRLRPPPNLGDVSPPEYEK